MRTLRRIIVVLLAIQAALLEAHFGVAHSAVPATILLIEGWDNIAQGTNVTSKGWNNSGNVIIGSSDARFGVGQGMHFNASNTTQKSITASATVIAGTAFKGISSLTPGTDFMVFMAGATLAVRLSVNASSQLQVRNSGGTVIATGTTVLTFGNWYYIEMKAFINGASGTCEVHLNGAAEIASTAGNFGSSNIDAFRVGGPAGSAYAFDDMYVCNSSGSTNNTFLGDVRVTTIYPTSDGAHTDWTPSSGSTHYTQVDDAQPNDDTDYNSDGTVGHIDTYGCSDVDGGATVYAAKICLWARKDDAGTRQIAPVVRQGGTDYVGTTVTMLANYQMYEQLYDQDPTSSNWTATNINNDEFGVKEIA